MTKITQDTELKVGMKVKINDEIRTIIEYSETKSLGFIDSNHTTTLCIAYSCTREQKLNELRDILIANNAELIEDNAKVVVSEDVGKVLKNIEHIRENKLISMPLFFFKLHHEITKVTDDLLVGWLGENNLSNEDLFNIYENGWEVEKSKRWRAEKCEKYYYINCHTKIESYLESFDDVDNSMHDSGNYFQTKEEAEAKAKFIRAILRGAE